MRKPMILFVVAACGISACVSWWHRPDATIRVLVFNMHAGKDASGKENVKDVAALARTSGATVVLLQEVDRGTARSGKVDQVAALSAASGFTAQFGHTLDYDGGQYGIATLGRLGADYIGTFPLSVTPPETRAGGSREPRGALVTMIPTARGRWQTINTHLDASAADTWRRQEADDLLDLVRERLAAGPPLAVGGDFNSTPDSAVHQALAAGGLRDAWA